MKYSKEEKTKLYIDSINFGLTILVVLPIFFASNFVNNSFEKSELLTEQFENYDELKTLYSKLKSSNTKSENFTLQSKNEDKLNSEVSLEIKQKIAKNKHESNSLKYDLLKLILIGLISVLLIKPLKNKKEKLNKKLRTTSCIAHCGASE
jgi:hypothetical protein